MPVIEDFFYALARGGGSTYAPVILIHGIGSSHLVWPAALRNMAGQKVLALDLPGHGKSGGHGMQKIASYANAVIHFMDAVGIYKAIFIGHSMGGAIGLHLARKYPERVAGLGLISVGTRFWLEQNIIDRLQNPRMLPDILDWFANNLFGLDMNNPTKDKVMDALRKVRLTVLAGDIRACLGYEFAPFGEKTQIPVLVVSGSRDKLIPLKDARFLVHNISQARHEIIPRAGHMVMLEAPEQVGAALKHFVTMINTVVE